MSQVELLLKMRNYKRQKKIRKTIIYNHTVKQKKCLKPKKKSTYLLSGIKKNMTKHNNNSCTAKSI